MEQTQINQREAVDITDISRKLVKLPSEDVLDFCNNINSYLLNFNDIRVFVDKSWTEKAKEKNMVLVWVKYSFFGTRRHNGEDVTIRATFCNYRAKDFSCKNISSLTTEEQ